MLPVLIAFAGVLAAAVATGMLAGRCVRGPHVCSAVWTVAAFGLTAALAAAAIGLATGFGPVTFSAVEIGGQLLAPLWLAWGLIELVAGSEAVRFAARLVFGFALTVVTGLILATGPLSAVPFSKAWPVASQHYQPVFARRTAAGAGRRGHRRTRGGVGGLGAGTKRAAVGDGDARCQRPWPGGFADGGGAAPVARRVCLSADDGGRRARLVRSHKGSGSCG